MTIHTCLFHAQIRLNKFTQNLVTAILVGNSGAVHVRVKKRLFGKVDPIDVRPRVHSKLRTTFPSRTETTAERCDLWSVLSESQQEVRTERWCHLIRPPASLKAFTGPPSGRI